MSSLAKVLIVGATNVGKSRLFNRLIEDKHSLVLDREGLTRDLIRRECWLSENILNPVLLIDSGGYSDRLEDSFFQSELNSLLVEELRSATVIIFLISKVEGVRLIEQKLSKLVHKNASCPVILGVNKLDSKRGVENLEGELQKLGFKSIIMLSAEHNLNIDALKKKIEALIPEEYQKQSLGEREIEKKILKLAIIGKVNVGKSSLVNALLNSKAIIVSQVEGTTIDLVEYELKYNSENYLLIDSPGWKKLKKEGLRIEELDFLSFTRAQKAIKIADILLFVLDLSSPLNYLDDRVAKEVFESNLPVVIVVNKWDLLNYPEERAQKKYEALIREKFYFLSWAPIIFISSKYAQKLERIFRALELLKVECGRKFTDFELESFLSRANLFLLNATKKITLGSITQLKSSIPTFLIKCSNPDNLNTQQLRMIETQFRTSLKCTFAPIKLYYKKSFDVK